MDGTVVIRRQCGGSPAREKANLERQRFGISDLKSPHNSLQARLDGVTMVLGFDPVKNRTLVASLEAEASWERKKGKATDEKKMNCPDVDKHYY